MAQQEIDFEGKSGKVYHYWIYKLGTTFSDEKPGNYIFAKESELGDLIPVYIGETVDLQKRINANHEKMPCVTKCGATYVCAHKSSVDKSTRQAEEKDLIDNYDPDCNKE
jgi:hypothetical protein